MDALRRVFAIDLRSLAAFRIAIALVVLFDLTTRLPWVRLFYSDDGIQPRAFVPFHPASSPLSIHTISGATGFQLALFAVALLAAVMLAVGWHTKLAAAVVYVHQTSLWWRNPTVTNAADAVLILMLFWSLFLPLGARASLDARRRKPGELEATHVASVGSAGLLIQFAAVYFFSSLHKSIGSGWWEGTAVFYAVSNEATSRPLGLWLRQFRPAVATLTWGTLFLEFVGPLLLFSPWWTPWLRLGVIAGFVALQLGIGFSMQLWIFPWLMTAGLLPFVPSAVWDALQGRRVGRTTTPPVIVSGISGPPRRRMLVGTLAAFALAYVLWSNVERQTHLPTPPALARVARWFGLNQGWYMFAYAPRQSNNLAVTGVVGENGQRLPVDDPQLGPHWAELEPMRRFFRGRLFLERLAYFSKESERAGFGDWVCRRWNGSAGPGQRFGSVELTAVRRSIEIDGSPPRVDRELIWTQPCP